MLYDPKRHEPLAGDGWAPDRAETAIAEIVRETVDAYEGGVWPPHRRDNGAHPSATLYEGAAGVLTALESLKAAGRDVDGFDLDRAWGEVLDTFRRAPYHDSSPPSLLCGSSGILVGLFGARGEQSAADELFDAVRDNTDNPAREFMWGAPGTGASALQMLEWTGDDRWADAYLESAEALWEQWWFQERAGCYLWTQRFPRRRVRWVGACHGQFGNLDVLFRGREHLSPPRARVLVQRAEGLLEALAVEERGRANWPAVAAERQPRLIQWCHGATGAVTAFHALPPGTSETIDDYLERAGNLVWSAGPLRKGPNICHGTSGSGYAFLKLWERTDDDQWLERAKKFAMHGIRQYRRIREEWGRSWYSLYTGDLGLAVFLQSCLHEDPRIPGLDYWPRRH